MLAAHDQSAGVVEVVGLEATAAEDEVLRAAQVGEEDAASVGGEGEPLRTERDGAAVVRVEVVRAPDEVAVPKKEVGARAVAAEVQLRSPAAAGSAAVAGEPVARQARDAPTRGEQKAAAACAQHDRRRQRGAIRQRRPARVRRHGGGQRGQQDGDHHDEYERASATGPSEHERDPVHVCLRDAPVPDEGVEASAGRAVLDEGRRRGGSRVADA